MSDLFHIISDRSFNALWCFSPNGCDVHLCVPQVKPPQDSVKVLEMFRFSSSPAVPPTASRGVFEQE